MNKAIDKLFVAIDYFTGILTGLMELFVFLNVVLRTFFSSGLTWSEDQGPTRCISAVAKSTARYADAALYYFTDPDCGYDVYAGLRRMGDGNAEYTRHNGSAADSILCFVLFRCADGCFHCDSGSGKHYPCVEES